MATPIFWVVDIPSSGNAFPLSWPSASKEVTFWFGALDHICHTISPGLDIQGNINASVTSVSNGIVSYVRQSPEYGSRVFVDFKLSNRIMQVRYSHLNPDMQIALSDHVSSGEVIGTMAENKGKSLLKIEIRESRDGKICNIDGSNTKLINPLTLFKKIC